MDLHTLQRKDVQSKLMKMTNKTLGDNVWNEFIEILQQLTGLIDVISQVVFLFTFFFNQGNGYSMLLVCLLPRLLEHMLDQNILRGGTYILGSRIVKETEYIRIAWFAHVVNKAYLRLCALGGTAVDNEYSEEIISSGLGRYFRTEYHKATEALGETPVSSYFQIILDDSNLLQYLVNVCTRDLSLVCIHLCLLFQDTNHYN
jgi:hypothetical protein